MSVHEKSVPMVPSRPENPGYTDPMVEELRRVLAQGRTLPQGRALPWDAWGSRVAFGLLAALWLLSAAGPGPLEAQDRPRPDPAGLPASGRVYRVIDGDTFSLRAPDGREGLRVRLKSVDAPELRGPAGRQDGGAEASAFAAALIPPGTLVFLEYEARDRVDRYGRALAHVTVAATGQSLNEELLRRGLAWLYWRQSGERAARYFTLQQQAQAARVGLWAPNRPPPPGALLTWADLRQRAPWFKD